MCGLRALEELLLPRTPDPGAALVRALIDGTSNSVESQRPSFFVSMSELMEREEAAEHHHRTNPLLVSHPDSTSAISLRVRDRAVTIMSLRHVRVQLRRVRSQILVVLQLPPPDLGVELCMPLLENDNYGCVVAFKGYVVSLLRSEACEVSDWLLITSTYVDRIAGGGRGSTSSFEAEGGWSPLGLLPPLTRAA